MRGKIRILFPMMDAHFALKPAVAQFEYAKQELWERNISYAEKIAVGPMIHPPVALVVGSFLNDIGCLSVWGAAI